MSTRWPRGAPALRRRCRLNYCLRFPPERRDSSGVKVPAAVCSANAGGLPRQAAARFLWPGYHTRRRPPLFPFVTGAPVWTVVDGAISGGCLGVRRCIRHTCAAARRGARFCTLLHHSCPIARFRLQIKRPRWGGVADGSCRHRHTRTPDVRQQITH